ncbi:MAG: RHS repeat-associated core domain-containing protein [Nibricoccus sp.]
MKDSSDRITKYTYDILGNLKRINRYNGTYRVFVYDAAGQVVQIEERRAAGDLIWFQAYRYDFDGRLKWSFEQPTPQSFTVSQDSVAYDQDNRVFMYNSQAVSHDGDGNMLTGPSASDPAVNTSYQYDARNRLKNSNGVSYQYNVDGARVDVNGIKYVVDPNSDLNRVFIRKNGSEITYYVWGLGLSYEVKGSSTHVYHVNHQGSTVALTDDAGTVTDRFEYEPFGKLTYRSGTTSTPFQLHGSFGVMTDPNGLVYMKSRYYHTSLKRFINADPSGFGGGSNAYAFAANSPLLYSDPTGLEALSRVGNAAAGAFGGGVGGMLGGAISGAIIGASGGVIGAIPGAIIGAFYGALNGAIGGAISGAFADTNSSFNDIAWNTGVSGFIWSPLAAAGPVASYADTVVPFARTVAAESEITVYRVFGGDARAQGFSWTTKDPRTVANFRDAAGLPSGGASGATNTADFLIQGKVKPSDIIKSRSALPLDGNKGGLPEPIIDPKNVNITDFGVLNP